MAAPDVRGLVPMEPPEGLLHWTLQHDESRELLRGALVYEIEWAERRQIYDILDEWAEPKKEKLVRVYCSCCGTSTLCDYAKALDGRKYGFVNIYADEDGIEETAQVFDGDDTVCPICGEPVRAFRAAGIGNGHKLIDEAFVLSAAVVAPEKLLALTRWSVQSRAYRSGRVGYEIIPAEACVLGGFGAVKLLNWRSVYNGSIGYYRTYGGEWRQPKKTDWGRWSVENIFALTRELVEESCLPNCKLWEYMQPRPGAVHDPVAYLRLYLRHPNVEAVLLHGLPAVLDGLIDGQVQSHTWDKNTKGLMALPQIDWAQTRPAQMLRLTKEELRMARSQYWGLWLWELFAGAKKCGQTLTAEDMVNAFRLGDEHIDALIPHGHLARDVRYLLRQCEEIAAEVDDAGADDVIPDAQLLLDYWDMSWRLGRDVEDLSVRYPRDLIAAHDRADELVKQKELNARADLFRIRRRALRKYSFSADGLLIRPAASQWELTEEGNALHHCVGTYGKKHATGSTAIFFIRRANRPKESWYTLQLDEKTLTVVQNRGKHNCARTPEVQAFEDKWLAWVRAGAPRDRDGKPILSQTKVRAA